MLRSVLENPVDSGKRYTGVPLDTHSDFLVMVLEGGENDVVNGVNVIGQLFLASQILK
jgi:hypothetical protein